MTVTQVEDPIHLLVAVFPAYRRRYSSSSSCPKEEATQFPPVPINQDWTWTLGRPQGLLSVSLKPPPPVSVSDGRHCLLTWRLPRQKMTSSCISTATSSSPAAQTEAPRPSQWTPLIVNKNSRWWMRKCMDIMHSVRSVNCGHSGLGCKRGGGF